MKKTENLTVRLDTKLKAETEAACEYLGKTLSDVVRAAFRAVIRQYHEEKAIESRIAREFMEGEGAQLAYDALRREIVEKGVPVHADGVEGVQIEYVVGKDGKSTLRPSPGQVLPPRVVTPEDGVEGKLATMPRKLRRQFERDRKKGRV